MSIYINKAGNESDNLCIKHNKTRFSLIIKPKSVKTMIFATLKLVWFGYLLLRIMLAKQ